MKYILSHVTSLNILYWTDMENTKWYKSAFGNRIFIYNVFSRAGYGLNGPGIESRWGARFSALVQTGPGAHPASYVMGTGSFPGGKAAGAWRWPSSAKVKERVELYLHSPSGPSRPVLRWNLPLLYLSPAGWKINCIYDLTELLIW
jgi:hypothetical protein